MHNACRYYTSIVSYPLTLLLTSYHVHKWRGDKDVQSPISLFEGGHTRYPTELEQGYYIIFTGSKYTDIKYRQALMSVTKLVHNLGYSGQRPTHKHRKFHVKNALSLFTEEESSSDYITFNSQF